MRPASRVRNFPGVVFLKYGGGIFENIPEKCGIFENTTPGKLRTSAATPISGTSVSRA